VICPPPDRALEGILVRLEPMTEAHREPLRSVAGHPEIWQWKDRRVFSVVDDEWPAVRKNLERRLAGAQEVGSA
jgi:hypothetical protein